MNEVDYLLNLNESGVVVYDNYSAAINNVKEWLDTPEGSVWGRPYWGNNLDQFKHEDTNSKITAVQIEFSILQGLARDLPFLQISSIWCEPHPEIIDRYLVTIGLNDGIVEKEV